MNFCQMKTSPILLGKETTEIARQNGPNNLYNNKKNNKNSIEKCMLPVITNQNQVKSGCSCQVQGGISGIPRPLPKIPKQDLIEMFRYGKEEKQLLDDVTHKEILVNELTANLATVKEAIEKAYGAQMLTQIELEKCHTREEMEILLELKARQQQELMECLKLEEKYLKDLNCAQRAMREGRVKKQSLNLEMINKKIDQVYQMYETQKDQMYRQRLYRECTKKSDIRRYKYKSMKNLLDTSITEAIESNERKKKPKILALKDSMKKMRYHIRNSNRRQKMLKDEAQFLQEMKQYQQKQTLVSLKQKMDKQRQLLIEQQEIHRIKKEREAKTKELKRQLLIEQGENPYVVDELIRVQDKLKKSETKAFHSKEYTMRKIEQELKNRENQRRKVKENRQRWDRFWAKKAREKRIQNYNLFTKPYLARDQKSARAEKWMKIAKEVHGYDSSNYNDSHREMQNVKDDDDDYNINRKRSVRMSVPVQNGNYDPGHDEKEDDYGHDQDSLGLGYGFNEEEGEHDFPFPSSRRSSKKHSFSSSTKAKVKKEKRKKKEQGNNQNSRKSSNSSNGEAKSSWKSSLKPKKSSLKLQVDKLENLMEKLEENEAEVTWDEGEEPEDFHIHDHDDNFGTKSSKSTSKSKDDLHHDRPKIKNKRTNRNQNGSFLRSKSKVFLKKEHLQGKNDEVEEDEFEENEDMEIIMSAKSDERHSSVLSKYKNSRFPLSMTYDYDINHFRGGLGCEDLEYYRNLQPKRMSDQPTFSWSPKIISFKNYEVGKIYKFKVLVLNKGSRRLKYYFKEIVETEPENGPQKNASPTDIVGKEKTNDEDNNKRNVKPKSIDHSNAVSLKSSLSSTKSARVKSKSSINPSPTATARNRGASAESKQEQGKIKPEKYKDIEDGTATEKGPEKKPPGKIKSRTKTNKNKSTKSNRSPKPTVISTTDPMSNKKQSQDRHQSIKPDPNITENENETEHIAYVPEPEPDFSNLPLSDLIRVNFTVPYPLSPGVHHTFLVTFKPKCQVDLSGYLSFYSEDETFNIPIEIRQKRFEPVVTESSVVFKNTVVGTTAIKKIHLKNTGGLSGKLITIFEPNPAKNFNELEEFYGIGTGTGTGNGEESEYATGGVIPTVELMDPDGVAIASRANSNALPAQIKKFRTLKDKDKDRADKDKDDTAKLTKSPKGKVEKINPKISLKKIPFAEQAKKDTVAEILNSLVAYVTESVFVYYVDEMKRNFKPGEELTVSVIYRPPFVSNFTTRFEMSFETDGLDFKNEIKKINDIVVDVTGTTVENPAYIQPVNGDFKICMINSLYQQIVTVYTTCSKGSGKVKPKIPGILREFVDIYPREACSLFTAHPCEFSVKFTPKRSMLNNPEKYREYFDPETNIVDFPIYFELKLPYKVPSPIQATFMAVLCDTSLVVDPMEIDFGECFPHDTAKTTISVYNPTLVPQYIGFVDVPDEIIIEPNFGFGPILPEEKVSWDILLSLDQLTYILKKNRGERILQMKLQTLAKEEYEIRIKYFFKNGSTKLTHSNIAFPATCCGSSASTTVCLNTCKQTSKGLSFLPKFQVDTDPAFPIKIDPEFGYLEPGKDMNLSLTFEADVPDKAVKEAYVELAKKKYFETISVYQRELSSIILHLENDWMLDENVNPVIVDYRTSLETIRASNMQFTEALKRIALRRILKPLPSMETNSEMKAELLGESDFGFGDFASTGSQDSQSKPGRRVKKGKKTLVRKLGSKNSQLSTDQNQSKNQSHHQSNQSTKSQQSQGQNQSHRQSNQSTKSQQSQGQNHNQGDDEAASAAAAATETETGNLPLSTSAVAFDSNSHSRVSRLSSDKKRKGQKDKGNEKTNRKSKSERTSGTIHSTLDHDLESASVRGEDDEPERSSFASSDLSRVKMNLIKDLQKRKQSLESKIQEPFVEPNVSLLTNDSVEFIRAKRELMKNLAPSCSVYQIPIYIYEIPSSNPTDVLYVTVKCPIQKPDLILLDSSHIFDFGTVPIMRSSLTEISLYNVSAGNLNLKMSVLNSYGPFIQANALRQLAPEHVYTLKILFQPEFQEEYEERFTIFGGESRIEIVLKGTGGLPRTSTSSDIKEGSMNSREASISLHNSSLGSTTLSTDSTQSPSKGKSKVTKKKVKESVGDE